MRLIVYNFYRRVVSFQRLEISDTHIVREHVGGGRAVGAAFD